jgi:uncharacterized membrane protein YiaA
MNQANKIVLNKIGYFFAGLFMGLISTGFIYLNFHGAIESQLMGWDNIGFTVWGVPPIALAGLVLGILWANLPTKERVFSLLILMVIYFIYLIVVFNFI